MRGFGITDWSGVEQPRLELGPGFGSEVGPGPGSKAQQAVRRPPETPCCSVARLFVYLLSPFTDLFLCFFIHFFTQSPTVNLANSAMFEWNFHIYHDNLFLATIGLLLI